MCDKNSIGKICYNDKQKIVWFDIIQFGLKEQIIMHTFLVEKVLGYKKNVVK